MSYLSRQDLKNLRAEAIAGTLFAPPQVIDLLDEIQRLYGHIEALQQELDHRALMERVDRSLRNVVAFTEQAVKGGA